MKKPKRHTEDWLLLGAVALVALMATLLWMADPAEGAGTRCDDGYTYVGEAGICASNDYYEVDGVRMPLGMSAVKVVLVNEGARLPTRDEVDAIWRAAVIKLTPVPFTRYDIMTTRSEFIRHDGVIDKQLDDAGAVGGELIAGHKKDVIAQRKRGRVTIYGWHRQNGKPIQPVYSGHGYNYRDYSHGIRLVKAPR